MSLLGAVGAIGSAVVGGASSLLGSNSSNAKAKRAATLAFQREKQLIDEANEYNKPVNQMARLEEAGLNPNLVYENGAQTLSASVGAPPQAKTYSPDVGKFNALQNYLMLENMERQEEKTQAEVDAIHNGIHVQNQNLEIAREMADLRKRTIAMQEKYTDARIQDMMNRQGDPTFDFLGGMFSGAFGDEPVPEIGNRDVRASYSLGANVGRFVKRGMKEGWRKAAGF